MPEYRVVAGTHRTQDGERVGAGETVELSEEEADRFPATKFERVESDDTDTDTPEPAADETIDTADSTEESVEETTTEETGDDDVPLEVNHDDPTVTDSEPEDVEASGDVPEDYDVLSKMAKHYDGEEVHGSMSTDELMEFFEDISDTEVAHLKESAREELSE